MKNRSYLLRLGAIRLLIKKLLKPKLKNFYQIGEVFQHEGQKYLVVESKNCRDCDSCIIQTNCTEGARPDGKDVIFKRLKK